MQEPQGKKSDLMDLIYCNTAVQKLCDSKNVIVSELAYILNDRLGAHIIKLIMIDMVYTDLKRTGALKQTFLKV